MSGLHFFSYPGMGETLGELNNYSQSVRIGNRIECSGQGGWDPESGAISKDIAEEIDQAFRNVQIALKDAGGKGWSQVYRINSYHTDMSEDALKNVVRNLKIWMPNHKPLLTAVGITQLGVEGMRIEIEAVALADEKTD